VGALVDRDGVPTRVRVRGGVVIASGGFERNPAMRDQYQPKPITTTWTMGVAENTGDGIRAGAAVGGALDLMDEAWWGPSLLTPEGKGAFTERAEPRSMLVNGNGERYTNEAAPYVNVCHAMYRGEATGVTHVPSWFVVDELYRRRYKLGPFLPRQPIPAAWFESGVAVKAQTIPELAAKIGVPADRLVASVARMNELARIGKD
ncbi:MAG TPA: FAD-binding protein, partial [Ilumatobacteraceae bacterium]|nr:FAD-binding protein [Ilumatobacteraceae bacterium]